MYAILILSLAGSGWPYPMQNCPRSQRALYLVGRFTLLSGTDSSDRTPGHITFRWNHLNV